jgi:tetratricopeptide (TPR) repeat protein
MLGDLRRGLEFLEEAVAHGERVGAQNLLFFSRNFRNWLLARMGQWDVVLPRIEEFLAARETGEPHYHEGGMRLRRGAIRLARDDLAGALEDIDAATVLANRAGDPQQWVHWFAGCARALVEAGRIDDARPLAHEALQGGSLPWALGELALVSEEVGCAYELTQLLEQGPDTKWTAVSRLLLARNFVDAAALLEEIGDAELEAHVRLRAAEQLVADGRRAEADEQLQRSLAFWRSVEATRYIRQAEALLAAAS